MVVTRRSALIVVLLIGVMGCDRRSPLVRQDMIFGQCQKESFSKESADRDDYVKACMLSKGYGLDGMRAGCLSYPYTPPDLHIPYPQDDNCYSPLQGH